MYWLIYLIYIIMPNNYKVKKTLKKQSKQTIQEYKQIASIYQILIKQDVNA